MFLEFHKNRIATLKSKTYLFIVGAGKYVELEMGKPQEVEDTLAYKILDQDGDIVRQVSLPVAVEDEKIKRKTKVVSDEKIKKA